MNLERLLTSDAFQIAAIFAFVPIVLYTAPFVRENCWSLLVILFFVAHALIFLPLLWRSPA